MSMNRTLPLATLLGLLLALTAALYWPGLAGPLLLDDVENLAPLQQLDRDPANWRYAVFSNESGRLGRPVSMATFVLDWLNTSGSTWHLKRTNLLIHLLCGTLVFLLTGKLLSLTAASRRAAWPLALWVTAAWLLTPLYASTVLYVVQRMAQLATVFVLGGLLCYVWGRVHLIEGRHRTGTLLLASAFVVFWPLAALSKENGALLPLLTFLVEWYFFANYGFRRQNRSFLLAHGILCLAIIAAVLASGILTPEGVLNGYAHRSFTLAERVLTELRILWDYALGLLVPQPGAFGIYHDDYLVSRGLLDPPMTLVALAAWIIAVMLALRARSSPALAPAGFGLLFFLGAHSLESTVIPLELYFEHRNYLPGYGLFLAAGVLFGWLFEKFALAERRTVLVTMLALVPAVYALSTWNQVQVWENKELLLLITERNHPGSARVQADLAGHYGWQGNPDAAGRHLDRLVALRPDAAFGAALQRLGVSCQADAPPPTEAYRTIEKAMGPGPATYVTGSLEALVRLREQGDCPRLDGIRTARAVEHWLDRWGGEISSKYRWIVHVNLGKLLINEDRPSAAIDHLLAAWALDPAAPEPGVIAVQVQTAIGELEAARETLLRLKRETRSNRADVNRIISRYEKLLLDGGSQSRRNAEDIAPGSDLQ